MFALKSFSILLKKDNDEVTGLTHFSLLPYAKHAVSVCVITPVFFLQGSRAGSRGNLSMCDVQMLTFLSSQWSSGSVTTLQVLSFALSPTHHLSLKARRPLLSRLTTAQKS